MTWFIIGSCILAGCNLGQREMEDTTPVGCAECHIDITHQWEQSAHAIAWTSPAFVEESLEHQEEYCLPCHAAKPLLEQSAGTEPRLRDANRQFGVDCNVCHQKGCGYVGPYRNIIEAHPTEQDTTRLPCADFCGTCHRMELEEYVDQYLPVAGEEKTVGCVGCHMSAYRSRLTQGHLLSYIHPKRTVRDHRFPVWTPHVAGHAVAVQDIAIHWPTPQQIEVRVTLLNRHAGHCIPVGEFGYRELLTRAEILASDGSILGSAEYSVFPGDEDCLSPGAPIVHTLEAEIASPAAAEKVKVSLQRVNEDRSFSFTLAEGSRRLRERGTGADQ